MDAIVTSVIGIAGVIVGAVLTTWLGPKFAEMFKLRETYLVPFRKWCSEFYGELDEFQRRYLNSNVNYSSYSDVQIIDDYRAFHEIVMSAPMWVGKIEKERSELANNVKGLIDIVDQFWHRLETQYNLQLQNRMDIAQLNNRQAVADEIRQHFTNSRQIYPDVSKVLQYLRKKKIP